GFRGRGDTEHSVAIDPNGAVTTIGCVVIYDGDMGPFTGVDQKRRGLIAVVEVVSGKDRKVDAIAADVAVIKLPSTITGRGMLRRDHTAGDAWIDPCLNRKRTG